MSLHQDFPNTSHKVGLGLIASAGVVSALSTLSLLSYIGWNALSTGDRLKPVSHGLRIFTQSPLGCYLISLLVCDFLQGVAFALNFQWAEQGLMVEGTLCVIQGIVSEIGDLGAALWSTAIAFHTFWLLFLVKQPHRYIVLSVLISGWSILIFLTILGPTVIQNSARGPFYGLSGAWCWIGASYGAERVIYLYGWVFAALGCSFIIYTLIYLRFSGFITFNGDGKLKVYFHRPPPSPLFPIQRQQQPSLAKHPSSPKHRGIGQYVWAKLTRNTGITSEHLGISHIIEDPECSHCFPSSNAQLKRVARRIMWYPVLYAVVVIPVAICRMGVLAGWKPPFSLLVFAGICFASSGLSNTLLFLITRKSFITQANMAPAGGIHITTQRFTVRDDAAYNERQIQLDPIKSSRPQLVSPISPKTPVVFYSKDSRKDSDSEEDRVIIIDSDHKYGDSYLSST